MQRNIIKFGIYPDGDPNQAVITAFLSMLNPGQYYHTGEYKIYSADQNGVKREHVIKLSHYGLAARSHTDGSARYDLVRYNNKYTVGAGNYGSVYPIIGTIKPSYSNPERLLSEPKSVRVVKLIPKKNDKTNDEHKNVVTREYEMMQKANYFGARQPLVVDDQNLPDSMLSITRFKGVNLGQLLYNDEMKALLEKQLDEEFLSEPEKNELIELLENNMKDKNTLLEILLGNNEKAEFFSYNVSENEKDALLTEKLNHITRKELKELLITEDKKSLSIDDRIQTTHKVLLALKQLHHLGIAHRDVKPENIMAYKNTESGIWHIKLLDLGLSCSMVNPYSGYPGTPSYWSPELCRREYHLEQTDVYALGRVTGLIWRDKELRNTEKRANDDFQQYLKIRINERIINYKMFDGIDISQDMKESVLLLVSRMTLYNFVYRWNLDAAIHHVDGMICKQIFATYPDFQYDDAIIQNTIQCVNGIRSLWYDSSIKDRSITGYCKKAIGFVDTLQDHPAVIRAFQAMLGQDCFCECNTSNDIKMIISDISATLLTEIIRYSMQLNAMKKMAKIYDKPEYCRDKNRAKHLRNHINSWSTFMDSVLNKPMDFDGMCDAVEKVMKKTSKLESAKGYYLDGIVRPAINVEMTVQRVNNF